MRVFQKLSAIKFTENLVFLSVVALFFSFLFISNTEYVRDMFRFETKDSVKAELVKAQSNVETLAKINDGLVADSVIQERANQVKISVVSNYHRHKEKKKEEVQSIEEKRDESVAKQEQVVVEETKVVDGDYVIPKAEYDQLSQANMQSIHDSFESLFEGS